MFKVCIKGPKDKITNPMIRKCIAWDPFFWEHTSYKKHQYEIWERQSYTGLLLPSSGKMINKGKIKINNSWQYKCLALDIITHEKKFLSFSIKLKSMKKKTNAMFSSSTGNPKIMYQPKFPTASFWLNYITRYKNIFALSENIYYKQLIN